MKVLRIQYQQRIVESYDKIQFNKLKKIFYEL